MPYRIQDSVKTFHVSDEAFGLFHADSGRSIGLNGTGSYVWTVLSEGVDQDEIVRRLVEHYDGCSFESASADVCEILGTLCQSGFIEPAAVATEAIELGHASATDAPVSLDISITGHCNARCLYCAYADEMQARPQDLALEQWLGFFRELGGLRTESVCFSGGEPFVRHDLWDLIDGVIAQRMRYSILSNGQLITENVIENLVQDKRCTRLDGIQVSIDGSRPEVHDKSRGNGAFAQAIRGLRLLKAAGLPVTCRLTVNRHNVDDLENTAHLLLDEIGVGTISTNEAMPQGRGASHRDETALLPEQLRTAMQQLDRLAQRYDARIVAMAGPLARKRTYARMEARRLECDATDSSAAGRLTACGCVFNKLAVLHDGTIVPCSLLPSLTLGRIGQDNLVTVWQHHPVLGALRSRRNIPLTEVAGCESCGWAKVCNGGCPALAYTLTGDFNRADPNECYRTFLVRENEHAV